MRRSSNAPGRWPALAALLLAAVVVGGCGGGGGAPILGFDSSPRPPTVTAVAPPDGATGVPLNTVVSADFSEAMAPITGDASFVLRCDAPCAAPTGTVSLDATRRIATFTLAAGTVLAPRTVYTATITGARSSRTGLAMVSPYTWRFTTQTTGGGSADTTRPRVEVTVPATTSPGPTPGVPANTAITATFSEDMAPNSISAASVTVACVLPCISPTGTVTYVVGNRMAVFTPDRPLVTGATYTVIITTAATDLAGNALAGNQGPATEASNYVWSFTTTAPVVTPGGLTVDTLTLGGGFQFCTIGTVNARFNVPAGQRLDPTTVNATNFTLSAPGGIDVPAASVVLDASGQVASFTPQAMLTPGVIYTARIRGGPDGVRDLAVPANALAADFTGVVAVGACVGAAPVRPLMGAAAPFGVFGTTGVTSQGLLTVINGDAGTTSGSAAVTGLHDGRPGCTYTETGANTGTVNGTIYTGPPPPTVGCAGGTAATLAVANQALADAQSVYNQLVGRAAGADPGAGNLAGLTLVPGTYTAAGGTFTINGGNLTLDAQGNADAMWVFQMGTALVVGDAAPRSVTLINGAQAKNVYWQVAGTATVNAVGGGTMVGTILSQGNTTVSTAGAAATTTLNGRAVSLGGTVTLTDTVVNVPAP
jgi:hypothetical protein